MEFAEVSILMMMGIVGSAFLIFLFRTNLITNKKIQKNTNPNDISTFAKSQIKTIQENYEEQIKMLKASNKSLQMKLNVKSRWDKQKSYENEDEEEEEEKIDTSQYVIDKELARPFLQKWGMNADALDNPMLQGLIKEKFKGNTETMIAIGLLRPKSDNQAPNQTNSGQQTINEAAQALINQGHYA